jgi:hypothetical protein
MKKTVIIWMMLLPAISCNRNKNLKKELDDKVKEYMLPA